MTTEMKPLNVLLISAAIAFAASCSVREDRSGCPAWITVCSDGYVADGCAGSLQCNLSTELRSTFTRGDYPLGDFECRGDLVFEVPRAEKVFVDVFGGVSHMRNRGAGLLISKGGCCDSLYTGHANTFISGDEGLAAMPLNKSFSTLEIHLKNASPGPDGLSPFIFTVYGNVDGYCIPGGEPHKGAFECMPERNYAGNSFFIRLPRQLDSSLMLEVRYSSDNSPLTEFPLGEIIAGMGYDWKTPDLRDISLEIDLVHTTFSITIEGWEKTETINIDL